LETKGSGFDDANQEIYSRIFSDLPFNSSAMETFVMRTWLLTGATTVLATAAALAMVSSAPKPLGEWKIADGTANVSIRSCGTDLCGFVSWAKESSAPLGREVLIDMKQNGHSWFGTAVNVVNGEQYTARMSLEGAATLKVEGCIIGGMICGGQEWSRVH
jgi:uncharacterized protein (DUF2147 family)